MSLLSVDITKVKRLSLKDIKLTTQPVEPTVKVYPEVVVERPKQTKEVDSLLALASKIIKGQSSYEKEELITTIQEATKVDKQRAERLGESISSEN